MKTQFTIYGEPQGKARARSTTLPSGHTIHYTPDGTVLYENLVKMEYRAQSNILFGDTDMIGIRVAAYYPIPKSTAKKKMEFMRNGDIRPTKKPDADNILKVICDALNGIAYRDDSQIVAALVVKYYGDVARVEVTVNDLKGETHDEL